MANKQQLVTTTVLIGFLMSAGCEGAVDAKIDVNVPLTTVAHVTTFTQRNMTPLESSIMPKQSRIVEVEYVVKQIGKVVSGETSCSPPLETKLVDKNDNNLAGMTLRQTFIKEGDLSYDGKPGRACVSKFTFSVKEDLKLGPEWALLVDGSRFPKMNASVP